MNIEQTEKLKEVIEKIELTTGYVPEIGIFRDSEGQVQLSLLIRLD